MMTTMIMMMNDGDNDSDVRYICIIIIESRYLIICCTVAVDVFNIECTVPHRRVLAEPLACIVRCAVCRWPPDGD